MAKIIGTAGSAPPAKPTQKTARVTVRAHTRAKPYTPPQSPDSRDNNRAARQPKPVTQPSPDAQDVAGRSSQQQQHDAAYAQDVQDAARGKNPTLAKELGLHPPKAKAKQGHGAGRLIASISPGAFVHALANVDAGASMPVFSGLAHVAGRGLKDAEEMAVTTPSSVAHLVDTGIHHPTQLPALLAKPYEDLAKHPIKTLSEHPLQTALLVAPAVRMPGRIVGKVARTAGKQTLERVDATLPGSALREKRTGSRDAFARVVQSHSDRKNPTPTVTAQDVRRRVDEYYGAAQRHMQRARAAANRQVKQRGLTGDAADQHISGVVGGTQDRLAQRFGREFGAIHQVSPQGHIVQPKGATEGALHATRAHADQVAQRLNTRAVTLPSGTTGPAVPLEWSVREAGDQYAVVPKFAADRLNHHQGVGSSKAMIARMMRTSRRALTSTVLPVSPKWLTGNVVEAALRSFMAGAGPTSYLRAGRLVRELDRTDPGTGQALLERTTPGGLVGRAAAHGGSTRTLEEEYAGSALANVARTLTHLGAKPGVRQFRNTYRAYTSMVYDTLNGNMERAVQKSMLGAALKRSPLMEKSVIGLSDRAISDAAKGLHNTEAQVALARAVQRMYGKYSNLSPELRSLVMHWSPFALWTGNTVRFIGRTLPHDHPIMAALVADANSVEAEWRKQHGLSLEQPNHVPDFLLGSVPSGKGMVRVARYTPFGVGSDVTGQLADLLLPQLSGAWLGLHGLDWKGDPLAGKFANPASQGERAVTAANSLLESMIPGVGLAESLHGRMAKGDTAGQALRAQFDPLAATKPAASSTVQPLDESRSASTGPRIKAVRVKPIGAAAGSTVKAVRVKPIRVR